VEDNADVRMGVAQVLNQAPGLRCVGTYGSGEAAVRDLPAQKPDVALVDIQLPKMNGIECAAKLKSQLPRLQVLMFTRFEQSDSIFDSIRAGASGYLLKNTPAAELVQAVEQVHAGGAPMTMQIARKVINYFHQIPKAASEVETLTSREKEVLNLVARGYPFKKIAGDLEIGIGTLRVHLRAIYDKLHVHCRTEAAVKYLRGDRFKEVI
jgi:DNA-binding NarL/FixJ family response regulator